MSDTKGHFFVFVGGVVLRDEFSFRPSIAIL